MMFSFGVFYRLIDGFEYDGFYPNHSEFSLFLCGLLLIYLGGVKDDLIGLRYRHKFTIQIISSVLVVISGFHINNFYGFLGIHEITPWIGMPLTVFIMVFIINAINLIDGIDGLASSISIFALCIYGTLFLLHGIWYYAALAFGTIGVLVPFFYYNVFGNVKKGRKLFMGDSGSLTLGFILGFLAIRYTCYKPDFIMSIGNALVVAVSPLLIPMLDVIRVVLIRIKKRKHLFMADRRHIHHKLQDMGMRKSSALILILSMSSVLCIMNIILMRYINCTYIFLTNILLWVFVNKYFSHIVEKRKRLKHNVNYAEIARSKEKNEI
ncbi:MAG: undecaprenyl/decaprenyl-phosphate alpha-N-acetylglucosaminyl 1-phosphate transferase [Tannerella sp.]|nr:undecaprenyl/decaprenyl-phosphate alpha-N-acetylglucosaminyl 1-phosphate transferase [Tannerella sp.]